MHHSYEAPTQLATNTVTMNQTPYTRLSSSDTLLPQPQLCTLKRRGATKASLPRHQIRQLHSKQDDASSADRPTPSPRQVRGRSPIPYAHPVQPRFSSLQRPPAQPPLGEVYKKSKVPTLCKRIYLSLIDRFALTPVKIAQKRISLPNGSVSPVPAPDVTAQLHCYLLEILSFTFGMDCHVLSQALGQQVYAHATTILSIQERHDLLQLSLMVQRLHQKVRKGEQKSMLLTDKEHVLRTIIEPVLESGYQAFVLDLIASYADHQGDPTKWRGTLMGHWSRRRGTRRSLSAQVDYVFETHLERKIDPMEWRPSDMGDWSQRRKLVQSLMSHARLVFAIAPNEEVKCLFALAIQRYQEERELKIWSLESLAQGSFEPAIRDGFKKVAEVLLKSKKKR
ncbi:hypothetical protein BU25DRAFT_238888 [Macroventuria anomochaeta]|uniref:Uncharacterized protein n=1 Tax=Macroventuria anomochaeta TaxID=301207 RepID=A0ACB6RHZ8_9PLEO|nr:uncharacterized protein BU25DRAFT_238888 [Macroventuria anomochaeta]KAF2621379.1 hypothetical protein BU25DRAFT_238888 [Macroventuria anomochaeta]